MKKLLTLSLIVSAAALNASWLDQVKKTDLNKYQSLATKAIDDLGLQKEVNAVKGQIGRFVKNPQNRAILMKKAEILQRKAKAARNNPATMRKIKSELNSLKSEVSRLGSRYMTRS